MNFRRVAISLGVAVVLIAAAFYIYGRLQPFVKPTLAGNQWVGTWEIESVDGKRFEQRVWDESFSHLKADREIAVFINNHTFNDDGTFQLEAGFTLRGKPGGSISSWEGIYTLSSENYRMINTPPGIKERHWVKAFFILLLASTRQDTGTWNRQGGTLTLISTENGGGVMIFKKKK